MTDDHFLDDPTIPDDAVLFRRVPPHHFVNDENLGRVRPSSAAFMDDRDSPMSAALASLCPNGPADLLHNHPGYALVAFTARFARDLGLRVVRAAQPDEPWHAYVVGNKRTNTVKRAFKSLDWLIPPP